MGFIQEKRDDEYGQTEQPGPVFSVRARQVIFAEQTIRQTREDGERNAPQKAHQRTRAIP